MLRLSLRSYVVDFIDVLEKDIYLLSVECKILYLFVKHANHIIESSLFYLLDINQYLREVCCSLPL